MRLTGDLDCVGLAFVGVEGGLWLEGPYCVTASLDLDLVTLTCAAVGGDLF